MLSEMAIAGPRRRCVAERVIQRELAGLVKCKRARLLQNSRGF